MTEDPERDVSRVRRARTGIIPRPEGVDWTRGRRSRKAEDPSGDWGKSEGRGEVVKTRVEDGDDGTSLGVIETL